MPYSAIGILDSVIGRAAVAFYTDRQVGGNRLFCFAELRYIKLSHYEIFNGALVNNTLNST